MDSLLQEINMLPGVLGCFVYEKNQQIAGSKMPPIFKESSIQNIGNLLSRTVQMGSMAQLKFSDIEIKYNESLILANPLVNDALLVSICEPNTNKSLVSMTTGMLTADIEAFMASGKRSSAPPAAKKTPAAQPDSSGDIQGSPKEAEISAELAPILEQVKDALALAIGPIAGPIMKDAIESWVQKTAPSRGNLSSLAELLCEEINDAGLEDEFMSKIKTFL